MAKPGIPSSFFAQTANAQNYLSWNITPGATSYQVQRSLDGVTFTIVSSPTATAYLDTAVTIGTTYYYQVAATNTDGTSAYTAAQSLVPVPVGEMCLGQIRLAAQQRADRVNSQFVTLPEWTSYINQSLFELYDLLVTQYGEEYFAASPAYLTTDGVNQFFQLPNGVLTFKNASGGDYVAPPFYKLLGVDLGISNGPNGWVSVQKFQFQERNEFFYPNTNSTIYGIWNLKYRLVGTAMEFIPLPSANQPMRIWYIPRMTMLLQDTDITTNGVSGWIEYVIVDAAIKALQKEESDVTVLAMQKAALIQRIQAASMNRDAGQPDRITDSQSANGWGRQGQNGSGWGSPW